MATRPVTDDDRAAVRRLHATGKGRNEIAKTLGRSGQTISKLADELGLSFARAGEVRAATEVRTADLAARRAAFAITLQDIAEREAAKMAKPMKYFDWGGKEHDYDEKWQDEPTPADKRALMATVATAVDRSMKLEPPKDDPAAQTRSMLGDLMAGLVSNYAQRHGGPPPEADDAE